jgi:putative FmdB family regulatory protein
MPLYEYVCERDGTVVELLRPASQADAPVDDPDGKGRTFKRKHSTFASSGTSVSLGARGGGGGCACGKPHGGCGSHG